MTKTTLWRRFRQQETIDDLRTIIKKQQTALRYREEERQEIDAVHKAASQWLKARIGKDALLAARHTEMTEEMRAAQRHCDETTRDLDTATRAAFMAPGLTGSWGRGVPRDWACGFDPQHGGPRDGGCECAGHGRSEETSRGCYYRLPVGKKEKKE